MKCSLSNTATTIVMSLRCPGPGIHHYCGDSYAGPEIGHLSRPDRELFSPQVRLRHWETDWPHICPAFPQQTEEEVYATRVPGSHYVQLSTILCFRFAMHLRAVALVLREATEHRWRKPTKIVVAARCRCRVSRIGWSGLRSSFKTTVKRHTMEKAVLQ